MTEERARSGLADLELELGYDSSDRALREFYVPCLGRSARYDRSVGYFRASALSVAARGLSRFISGGGQVRLLVGAEVAEQDAQALAGATEIPPAFAARLAERLVTADEVASRRLEVLAWLVQEGRLEVRVAVALDDEGRPLVAGEGVPYFHEKIGVLRDSRGDGVAFQGSINESATAWTKNFESFSVYTSWGASAPYFDHWVRKFEDRWSGNVSGFRIYELPVAVRDRLLRMAPEHEPAHRDPEEPPSAPDRTLLARVLRAAPRAVGADTVAEATTGVRLFPHQRQVVERLAGQFPRSWLVADEVGLGKTISAGTALRRLLLSGQVQRALVLAPANVCRQWQDELFEKFGLWVPRLEGGKILGAHPDDVRPLAVGENPYATQKILVASSHTARRREHQTLIEQAAPFDVLIVDEAHHARRQGFADLTDYRPSRLLALLDRLSQRDLLRTVWFLTATPMQVHPIELRDLLRHVGLDGTLASWQGFQRFYRQLAQPDDNTSWAWLATALRDSSLAEIDRAGEALLRGIDQRVGVVAAAQIRNFDSHPDPAAVAQSLGAGGRNELRKWLRHRGPVGQAVTRHTRSTLKEYQRLGLLDEPIADRDVDAVPITFAPVEQALYDRLDELIDRLMSTHADRRGAGFVLTVYRRRLTSSWAAIRSTLRRRLDRERQLVIGESDDAPIEAELDTGASDDMDDIEAVPLSDDDLEQVESFLSEIEQVPDSKFDRLESDLNDARGSGRSMIVFTQFADTLGALRDRLLPAYQAQLATYTGEGARMWRPEEGWVQSSKQELVDAVRSGRVTVLLATDAASEGINLQACSSLINYDLPWNPMRVEQRIGRIDRIGQQRPVVTIRNYVVPGTVEERVYSALAGRIDDFAELLGNLQPILGQTERAFQRIFRAPRSEREKILNEELQGIEEQIGELRESGIDLSSEDPLPIPDDGPPLLDLEALTRALVEDLGLQLGQPGQPVTSAPERATRDPGSFAALLTYGHPELDPALRVLAEDDVADSAAVVIAEHVGGVTAMARADRSPAVMLRRVDELRELNVPHAAGEAEALAARLAAEEARRREERRQRWLGRSEARWHAHARAEFCGLVRRVVGIDVLLGEREHGTTLDPILAWHALAQDATTGWAYAEAFRRTLGLEIADLLPEGPLDTDASASARELRRRRVELGRALLELMGQWRERQQATYAPTAAV